MGPKGLLSCPNAGLWSARLLGSIAAEGSPRIGRTAIERRLHSCTSPQFGSCLENFVIPPKVSGQTLRAVDDEQPTHRRVKPTLDQIVDQRLHDSGIFGRPFNQAERMLVAVAVDAQ